MQLLIKGEEKVMMVIVMVMIRGMVKRILRIIVRRLSVTRTRTLRRSCLLLKLLLRMAASHFPC